MALATYSDLQSAIASWLARTDLTSVIPDFVTLAEARINRVLRVRDMLTTATGSVSTSTLTVPSDFVEAFMMTLDTETDKPLEYRPAEDSQLRVAGTTNGQPLWFTIVGDEFRFYPSPDSTYDYTLEYYAKVPSLSSTVTTNWLLSSSPDLYLFGALAEASAYLHEEEREAYWSSKFNAVKAALNGAEKRTKRTSGPLRMRVVA